MGGRHCIYGVDQGGTRGWVGCYIPNFSYHLPLLNILIIQILICFGHRITRDTIFSYPLIVSLGLVEGYIIFLYPLTLELPGVS